MDPILPLRSLQMGWPRLELLVAAVGPRPPSLAATVAVAVLRVAPGTRGQRVVTLQVVQAPELSLCSPPVITQKAKETVPAVGLPTVERW